MCNSLFQSTHLHEVWLGRNRLFNTFFVFQSTHLHEVWLNFYILRACFWSFNPHTYMRCDVCRFKSKSLPCVSIHTPTWGVTNANRKFRHFIAVSIHTPTWGVTLRSKLIPINISFNPHTYMRCDTSSKICYYVVSVSIHTPTWGVTIYQDFFRWSQWVSIHTPTWGVTSYWSAYS